MLYVFNDGLYLPFIYMSYTMPFLYLLNKKKGLDILDYHYLGLFGIVLLSSFVFNSTNLRISTVLYSGLFIFTFLCYKELLMGSQINPRIILNLIKSIICAFAIVMVLQQIQVLFFHTTAFNGAEWQTTIDRIKGAKFNSLSYEASNVPLVLFILTYSYTKIQQYVQGKKLNFKDSLKQFPLIWFCFFYVVISTFSLTSLFIVPFIFVQYVKISVRFIVLVVFAVIFAGALFPLLEGGNFERYRLLVGAITTLDVNQIIAADPSGAVRIFPYFEYVSSLDFIDIHTWLGHGTDSAKKYLNIIMFGDPDMEYGVGNITSFFYDYGLIAAIVFLSALKRTFNCRWFSFEMLCYWAVYSILQFNHTVLWLFIIMMFTIAYYKRYAKVNN